MKFPKVQSSGIGTTGATGVAPMVLHLTGTILCSLQVGLGKKK